MAKSSNITDLALKGTVLFVLYKVAANGAFDRMVPGLSTTLRSAFKSTSGVLSPDGRAPVAAPTTPAASGNPTGGYGGNPNFWQQVREWQAQSGSRDWEAFRTHLYNLHAPDPGNSPPAGW